MDVIMACSPALLSPIEAVSDSSRYRGGRPTCARPERLTSTTSTPCTGWGGAAPLGCPARPQMGKKGSNLGQCQRNAAAGGKVCLTWGCAGGWARWKWLEHRSNSSPLNRPLHDRSCNGRPLHDRSSGNNLAHSLLLETVNLLMRPSLADPLPTRGLGPIV
jgi:hypothetical protein